MGEEERDGQRRKFSWGEGRSRSAKRERVAGRRIRKDQKLRALSQNFSGVGAEWADQAGGETARRAKCSKSGSRRVSFEAMALALLGFAAGAGLCVGQRIWACEFRQRFGSLGEWQQLHRSAHERRN